MFTTHKLTALAAFGAGYVLGAKAGRTRYEQIRRGAQRFMENPKVRQAAHVAQERVQEQAPAVKQKVAQATEKVRHHGDHAAGASGSSSGWPQDESWRDPVTTSGQHSGGTTFPPPSTT